MENTANLADDMASVRPPLEVKELKRTISCPSIDKYGKNRFFMPIDKYFIDSTGQKYFGPKWVPMPQPGPGPAVSATRTIQRENTERATAATQVATAMVSCDHGNKEKSSQLTQDKEFNKKKSTTT